jgi:hypothetical protein
MFQKQLFLSIVKTILKNNFLNPIPVLRYRGYRHSGTSIRAVLSKHEGTGQKTYRNLACIIPGCTG